MRWCLTYLATLGLSAPVLAQDLTLTAVGNEPFWRADIANDLLTLQRLGMENLTLPLVALEGAEAISVILAADADEEQRVALTVADVLCHDSMSGMPFPAAASVTTGDTILVGCAGDPLDLLTGTQWQVDAMPGVELSAEAPPRFQFEPTGQITGRGGCNRFFAPFELTGEALIFGPVGATRLACPGGIAEQEAGFFAALEQVDGFDISDTGLLILRSASDALIVARR